MAYELKRVQHLVYRLITAPDEKVPGGIEMITGDARLSARERITIYSDAYFHRILACLKEDFPASLQVCGPDEFAATVRDYLGAHPPSEPNIHYAGAAFSSFIAGHRIGGRFPYLADLAMLERATIEAFHGPDAPPATAEELRRAAPEDWPHLRLATHPASILLDCRWRVTDLLRSFSHDGSWPEPARDDISVLVWRQDDQVFYRTLDNGEREALGVAQNGAAFAEICEAASIRLAGDPAAAINQMLARWVADGVLVWKLARAGHARGNDKDRGVSGRRNEK
ncbi:MAG: DNA-binding domain-containing protein [Candidatus Binataceae bacterium]